MHETREKLSRAIFVCFVVTVFIHFLLKWKHSRPRCVRKRQLSRKKGPLPIPYASRMQTRAQPQELMDQISGIFLAQFNSC